MAVQLERDFRSYLNKQREFGTNGHSSDVACAFVPFSALTKFFTVRRIQEFLSASGQNTLDSKIIQRSYLRVFATLILIRKTLYISYFVQPEHSDDTSLPFYPVDSPPQFLTSEYVDFFEDFHREQWQFCAVELKSERLMSDRDFDPNHIFPITRKLDLAGGTSGAVYKVTVHGEYNLLFDDHGLDAPTQDIFVLKTYSTDPDRAKEYYSNEVYAFKHLMAQNRVEQNMISFYGSWRQNNTYNVLLEYADQGTLLHYFEKNEPPTEEEDILKFWSSLFDVVKALVRIHELEPFQPGPRVLQGIHEDVQPSNILVCSGTGTSPYEVVFKLADLGLTHFTTVMEEEDHESVAGYGSRMYSAPEVCRAHIFHEKSLIKAKPHIDVWSLGCVLSEAAAWAVIGKERLSSYRDQRAAETDKIPYLQAGGYSACFHDGGQVLPAVLEMHKKIRKGRRNNDYIIENVVRIVEGMLAQPKTRWGAAQVYNEWERFLATTKERTYPVPFQTLPTPLPPLESSSHLSSEPLNTTAAGLNISLDHAVSIEVNDTATHPMSSPTVYHPSVGYQQTLNSKKLSWQEDKYDPAETESAIEKTYFSPVVQPESKWPNVSIQDVHSWILDVKNKKYSVLEGSANSRRLKGRDHVFLIDDSESMKDHWGSVLRVFHALAYLVKKEDPDGIDMYLANTLIGHHKRHTTELVEILQGVRPQGYCNMKEALGWVLEKFDHGPPASPPAKPRHRSRWSLSLSKSPAAPPEKRGLSIYVLTDGVWQDGPGDICGVEEPIKLAVSKLEQRGMLDSRIGIQFVQFGNHPVGIRRLKLLDDELKKRFGIAMDIVDRTPYTGSVWKMLIGAIDRHWDGNGERRPPPSLLNRQSYGFPS